MKLLVYVLNQTEKLEEVLAAFVEIGVTGATVVDSVGMGRIIAQDVPIFASFQSLLSSSRPYNKTILSVMNDDAKLERALALIQEICGPFDSAGAGVAFTLPIEDAYGIKPEFL